MSRSHAIWHDVRACIYKSSKSYGAKDTSEDSIYVGSSASNSHKFVDIITTKRIVSDPRYGDTIVFKISLDDVVLKEMIFKNNKGRAGEYIKTVTKLNKIKSL